MDTDLQDTSSLSEHELSDLINIPKLRKRFSSLKQALANRNESDCSDSRDTVARIKENHQIILAYIDGNQGALRYLVCYTSVVWAAYNNFSILGMIIIGALAFVLFYLVTHLTQPSRKYKTETLASIALLLQAAFMVPGLIILILAMMRLKNLDLAANYALGVGRVLVEAGVALFCFYYGLKEIPKIRKIQKESRFMLTERRI